MLSIVEGSFEVLLLFQRAPPPPPPPEEILFSRARTFEIRVTHVCDFRVRTQPGSR